MADQYSQDGEPLDIFGSDPFGRNYLYGLRGNGDGLGLQPPAQGLPVDTRPYDRMQATPRGFISGLFSDVLGGALNMPDLPKTGVPSLDLLYANRNPLMKLMGVGDVQKTAERISYGEPLTTGSGMTLKPREETVFATMAVAPFVGEATALGYRVGRTGARMVGERMAENLAMGRPNLPNMMAEPKASLFAVEPSPMAMPKPQAPVSELGFYSAAEQAALNLPRNKGTGQAFLNDLMKSPDVKKDELAWTGLDDFLKEKPNVTKQEVQDYLANNKVDLQEVSYGNIDFAKLPDQQLQKEYVRVRGYEPLDSDGSLMSREEIIYELSGAPATDLTRYGQYQLAGGENYREILLKMPNQWDKPRAAQIANEERIKALRQEMYGTSGTNEIRSEISRLQNENTALQKQISESPIYKSSHFDEPNILAHMRVNDRIDADGKKMLLVEEIQSDWHQAGRERGYKNPEADKALEIESKAIADERKNLVAELSEQEAKNGFVSLEGQQRWDKFKEKEAAYKQKSKDFSNQVPDAPFKDTWYQLALKRIMKYAADNGYERVGLTTGTQQAERYDLSKQVDELLYKKNADGTYQLSAQANGRGNMLGESIPENKLSDYVGKEVATKIAENSGRELNLGANNQPKDMWKGLSGIDLKIGGEGMKKYYDEIYPKFLEKYGKKWDASVGETKLTGTGTKDELAEKIYGRGETYKNLPSEQKRKIDQMFLSKGEPVRYIDITPKMKESVGKGQPLFTAIPAGTLGLGGLEYADPFASPLTEDTTR